MIISECPFCDSFNFSEVTVNHYFCRNCGEKWIESDEITDDSFENEYLKEYQP